MSQGIAMTVGLDLGDREARIHILDESGACVYEGALQMSHVAVRHEFSGRAPMRVVMEAGGHSRWVSKDIEELGHEVLVANPRRVRLIYGSDDKTDKMDAERLALLGRADPRLLYPITHRGEDAQAALAVLRSREALVKTRTQLINHVRGAVKSEGERMPSCSTESFHTRLEDIPEAQRAVLGPLMGVIERTTVQIKAYDTEIERLGQEVYPETELLRQVNGVGPLIALAYLATLEDPRRYRNSRAVGRYLGLVPKLDQSGNTDKQLRISKAGDVYLRKLLVQSANYILGPFGQDSDLRRWGLKLAETGGRRGRRRAKVAVARKLAVILHSLWKTGEEYEPLRNTRLRGELDSVGA